MGKTKKNKNFSQMVKHPQIYRYTQFSPQVIIFIVSQFKRQKTWTNFVHFVQFVWQAASAWSVWYCSEAEAAAVEPKAKTLME